MLFTMSTNFSRSNSLANSASYSTAAEYRRQDSDSLASLIQKVLKDRALLDQLCDRVYQIMLTDLRQQQERSRNYTGL